MKKLIVVLLIILLVELAILALRQPERDGAPHNVVKIALVFPE